MAWKQLGIINLTYDWQFLAVPNTLYNLFRITQLYSDTDYIHGKIIIGQVFNDPKEFHSYKAIYPSKSKKIIKLATPLELITGFDVAIKYLGFKFDNRYYRYSVSWSIQIEVENAIAATLEELRALTTATREEIALLQTQIDRIEQSINTTYGQ